MALGLLFKAGAVAAMAFAGLLAGVISMLAPASRGGSFDHVLTVVAVAIAATKIGAAAVGLIAYRAED
jgi:hypothetical protein